LSVFFIIRIILTNITINITEADLVVRQTTAWESKTVVIF